MQLALAVATLANNGVMLRPRLALSIDNVRTGERRNFEPQRVHQVPVKAEHLEFVKRAMAGVNKEGTGRRAFADAPYTSAGKTGTAQVVGLKQNEKYVESKVSERLRDHSLFIVFAPVENPRIALAALVENGGFGARAAAPLARAVLDYYLLGKLPEAMIKEAEEKEEEESD
jgi:penicillin-binding protein 2